MYWRGDTLIHVIATQLKHFHQLPKQTDSTNTNLKNLQKTFFSPPRTKNDHVNDMKEQTLLQNQQKSNPRSRTEQWNDQKDFIFHQKSHKNQNFTRKSFNKQKKNILLHEQSLNRATFTRFSNENEIKNEPFAQMKNAESDLSAESDLNDLNVLISVAT